jgi:hypothetical protein
MAASPFPPPTPVDVDHASSLARDWGTLIVGLSGGILGTLAALGRAILKWVRRHEARQMLKFAAVDARLAALELERQATALKIAKLETIEHQVENLSSRLDAGFAGVNSRLDAIAMRQPG